MKKNHGNLRPNVFINAHFRIPITRTCWVFFAYRKIHRKCIEILINRREKKKSDLKIYVVAIIEFRK